MNIENLIVGMRINGMAFYIGLCVRKSVNFSSFRKWHDYLGSFNIFQSNCKIIASDFFGNMKPNKVSRVYIICVCCVFCGWKSICGIVWCAGNSVRNWWASWYIYICLTYKLNRHKNLDVVKHRSLILRWLEAAHIIIPDHPLFRYYFIHTNSIAILLTLWLWTSSKD